MSDLEDFAKEQAKTLAKAGGKKIAKAVLTKVVLPILPIILIILLVLIIIIALCGGLNFNTDAINASMAEEGVITEYNDNMHGIFFAAYNEEKLWQEVQENLKDTGTTLESIGLGKSEEEAKKYLTKFILAECATSYLKLDEEEMEQAEKYLADNEEIDYTDSAKLPGVRHIINGGISFKRYDSDGNEIELRILEAEDETSMGYYLDDMDKNGVIEFDENDKDAMKRMEYLIDLLKSGYKVNMSTGEITYYAYTKTTITVDKGDVENENDEIQEPETTKKYQIKIQEKKINYKTIASKYSINVEWFLGLVAATQCPEYAAAFADYVIENTDIVIAIQDSKVDTTHVEDYIYDVEYTFTDDKAYDDIATYGAYYDWWWNTIYYYLNLRAGQTEEEATNNASSRAEESVQDCNKKFEQAKIDAQTWKFNQQIQQRWDDDHCYIDRADYWIGGRRGNGPRVWSVYGSPVYGKILFDFVNDLFSRKNPEGEYEESTMRRIYDGIFAVENEKYNYRKLEKMGLDGSLGGLQWPPEGPWVIGILYDHINYYKSQYSVENGNISKGEFLWGIDFVGENGARYNGFCNNGGKDYYDTAKKSYAVYKVKETTLTEEITAFSYVEHAETWFANVDIKHEDLKLIDEPDEVSPEVIYDNLSNADISRSDTMAEIHINPSDEMKNNGIECKNSNMKIPTRDRDARLDQMEKVSSNDKVKINETKVSKRYSLPPSAKETNNADILLGFWKNENGESPYEEVVVTDEDGNELKDEEGNPIKELKIKKKEDLPKFDIDSRKGETVKYKSLKTGKEDSEPGRTMVNSPTGTTPVVGGGGSAIFFNYIKNTDDGQVQETIMRYLLHLYTGQDFGVTNVNLTDLRFYVGLGLNEVLDIQGNSTKDKLWYALKSVGLSDIQAAAVMANIQEESGFRTNNLGDDVDQNYGGDEKFTQDLNDGKISRERFTEGAEFEKVGYGLAQWTASTRKERFIRLCKITRSRY